MQFLNPAFFLGLVAAGIPILLHFLSRRRFETIPFAPLRFLIPSQERQMRKLSLRRLLLLILRVLIIVLVVMAMARPTLTGGLAGLIRPGEKVSVVILVDASASMQAQQGGGSVFERAKEEAASIAGELRDGDEMIVALFSDHVQPLFSEFLSSSSVVLTALEDAQAHNRPGDYAQALSDAMELLDRATFPQREIYLISDFQKTAQDSLRLRELKVRMDTAPAARIFLRAIEVEPFVNRQIEDVERPAALLQSQQTTEVVVLSRQDGSDPAAVPLFLELDGATIAEAELNLPDHGSQRHVFGLTLPEAGDLGVTARLRPDRYALDDRYHFVLPVIRRIPVLALSGIEGGQGESDPMLFLSAALRPAGRSDGRFDLQIQPGQDFDEESLPQYPLVVGCDLRGLGSARFSALDHHLKNGGSLLLFVGDPRVREYTNETLLPSWTDLQLGSFRGSEDSYERLTTRALDHPVFTGFLPEEIATLEEVRLRNFFRLPADVGQSLLSYSDGSAAVVEFEVGKGRVILCAFHTAATAGDLPYSPMFLPLVQRMAGYLATRGWGRYGRQFEVGSTLTVEAPEGAIGPENLEVLLPDGQRLPVKWNATLSPPQVEFEQAPQAGLYRFLDSSEPWAQVAVNMSRVESDRQFWSTGEYRTLMDEQGISQMVNLSDAPVGELIDRSREGRPIHRWFLVLAGVLLAIEGLISRRIGGKNPA